MKENEAITYLKNRYLAVGSRVNGGEKGIKMCEQHNEAIDMAINALQEIQIYRTSEAVARRTNAMRKQQAVAPVFIGEISNALCPECGKRVCTQYCPDCGQKIKW